MTVVIDQDGNAQQWTAVYWRYGARERVACDSFGEAYRLLDSGEDFGSLSSDSILGPDGAVLMDKRALWDAQIHGVDPDELFVRLSQRAIGGAS